MRRWIRARRAPRSNVKVLDGLDVTRMHERLAVGPRVLHANLLHLGEEWPVARQTVRVYVWMTGFEIGSPVEWSGREHAGDYHGVGFWDDLTGGDLVLSASVGPLAHLGRGDRVLVAAGHLYGR